MKKTIKYNIYRQITDFIRIDELIPVDSTDDKGYQWDRLKEDIKKDGLLHAIRIYKREGDTRPYIADGNHRLKVLKELYEGDYLVPVYCKLSEDEYKKSIIK
jgi:hypothetical protein